MEIEKVVIPAFILVLFGIFEHYNITNVDWASVACIAVAIVLGLAILWFVALVLRWIITAIMYSMCKMNRELSKND